MCDVHKTERAVHGPFSARLWSVQYPFESRLTSVLLKRSGVKRTVHGKFFLPYTVYSTLFKIQERKADRRSKEIEQRKESQNTHKTRTDM